MMRAWKSILLAPILGIGLWVAQASPEAPVVESTKPQNGVYVSYTGYMKTVIELKDGRFRYWFESDAKVLPEPTYPLSGDYAIEGSKIVLDHEKVYQKEWTFRKVEGVVTLWRPDALKIEADGTKFTDYYPLGLENFKRCGAGAILVETGKAAEKAWKETQYVTLSKPSEFGAPSKEKPGEADRAVPAKPSSGPVPSLGGKDDPEP